MKWSFSARMTFVELTLLSFILSRFILFYLNESASHVGSLVNMKEDHEWLPAALQAEGHVTHLTLKA